jgi:predicted phosphodiesterase
MEFDEVLDLLVDKVEDNIDLSWQDIIDEYNLDINRDTLRKCFNGEFGGYNVYKYMKANQNTYASDEQIEKFEQIKDEVYRERVKLQDARRELNKYNREYARQENLMEVLADCMEDLPEIKLNYAPVLDDNPPVHEAALIISDIHDGIKIDNVSNYYDKEVVEQRMSQLCFKAIQVCLSHGINTLNIELCGDLIAGAIHTSVRVEQEEDLISAIIHVSEVLSQFINEIKNVVPNVNVYAVCGNHGRTQSKLSDNINRENYERLIFEYIKLRVPSVKVYQNGWEDFIHYKIGDKEIVVMHGDKDSLTNAKNHCCNLLGKVVDEIHMGHIHQFNMKDDNGTLIVVNGSVVSTDSYAMSLRQITKPYQVMRVYGENEATYRLMLD